MKTQNEAILELIAMRAAHLDAEMFGNLAKTYYGEDWPQARVALAASAALRKNDAKTHFENLKAYLESLG